MTGNKKKTVGNLKVESGEVRIRVVEDKEKYYELVETIKELMKQPKPDWVYGTATVDWVVERYYDMDRVRGYPITAVLYGTVYQLSYNNIVLGSCKEIKEPPFGRVYHTLYDAVKALIEHRDSIGLRLLYTIYLAYRAREMLG